MDDKIREIGLDDIDIFKDIEYKSNGTKGVWSRGKPKLLDNVIKMIFK